MPSQSPNTTSTPTPLSPKITLTPTTITHRNPTAFEIYDAFSTAELKLLRAQGKYDKPAEQEALKKDLKKKCMAKLAEMDRLMFFEMEKDELKRAAAAENDREGQHEGRASLGCATRGERGSSTVTQDSEGVKEPATRADVASHDVVVESVRPAVIRREVIVAAIAVIAWAVAMVARDKRG